MYTVKELIETLQQCPPDYPIEIATTGFYFGGIDTIGIDHEHQTVDLYFNTEEKEQS